MVLIYVSELFHDLLSILLTTKSHERNFLLLHIVVF